MCVVDDVTQVIRAMYSSPPRHGAEIAQLILSDADLFTAWKVRSCFFTSHTFVCVGVRV